MITIACKTDCGHLACFLHRNFRVEPSRQNIPFALECSKDDILACMRAEFSSTLKAVEKARHHQRAINSVNGNNCLTDHMVPKGKSPELE